MTSPREKLVSYLEQHAFQPVMHAKPEAYHGEDRATLQELQHATQAEIERYRNYESAEEVLRMFHDDVHSHRAQKVHADLNRLGLPTLEDHEIQEGFDRLARKLDIADGA